MNTSKKIILISSAVILAAVSSVVVAMMFDESGIPDTIKTSPKSVPTDPKYFGQEDYLDGIVDYVGDVDPYALRNESDLIVSGVITNKTYGYDPQSQSTPGEPPIRIIEYEVAIFGAPKGQDIPDEIKVVTHAPSNLVFDIHDEILVMAEISSSANVIEPIAGPHAMFKIIDDSLVGHTKTLKISDIFPDSVVKPYL